MRVRAVAVVVLGLVLGACRPAYGPVPGGSTRTVADGHVTAAIADTGVRGIVNDVVERDGDVVALVSTDADLRGDTLLRSADGGATWTRSSVPIGTAVEGPPSGDWTVGPAGPRLHGAGRWLVATRTINASGGTWPNYEPTAQAVAISSDGGQHWTRVRLDVPDGSIALVRAAVVIGRRLVLAGTVQGPIPPHEYDENGDDLHQDERGDVYDAGVWWSDEPTAGFTRVTSSTFAGVDEAQTIVSLHDYDGRLIATGGDSRMTPMTGCCFNDLGPVSWSSPDGASWSLLDGPATPAAKLYFALRDDSRIEDGLLVWPVDGEQRRVVLDPGSSSWRQLPDVPGIPAAADRVRLDERHLAATWVENAACDCSYAFAGSVIDGHAASGRLSFDRCVDTSVRGAMSFEGGPHVLGDSVLAVASCNNHDREAANLVWSTDRGATWQTQRLQPFATAGHDLQVDWRGGVTSSWSADHAVLLFNEGRADAPPPDSPAVELLPIRAIRLQPAATG